MVVEVPEIENALACGLNGDGDQKVNECVLGCKSLRLDNTNPCILSFKQMEFAVRGPVICRALEIEKEMKNVTGNKKPFNEVIKANVGDAHAMGQKPITFIRQVIALISFPDLIENSRLPEDVKTRARDILASCSGGSAGSYTDSRGIALIRNHVAEYIQRRDMGIPSNADDIILVAGASEGIRACLKLFRTESGERKSGIMIPVPQFPMYQATIQEFGMNELPYYLNESHGWSIEPQELNRCIIEGKKTSTPRALVVINPGNPTGNVLTRDNMEAIIRFAYQENLFLLADEVYQENIYDKNQFLSFKRVMKEMGAPYSEMELVSFFSCSKGYACECGLRGGYCEVVNMDPAVKQILFASIAAKLCPTVLGQAAVDCIVNPPRAEDPSYSKFVEEKATILKSLEEKAHFVQQSLAEIPGIECQTIEGSMYAYPRLHLPPKAIEAAKEKGLEPDVFYGLELLNTTGISIVPGSGLGQVPGTYHFRTTLLPPLDKLKTMMTKLREFQLDFLEKYS